MPPKLSTSANLADVEELSDLNAQEWLAFLKITRDVAKEAKEDLGTEHHTVSWMHMSSFERAQAYQEAERRLQEHGTIRVNENIVRWRLSQILSA